MLAAQEANSVADEPQVGGQPEADESDNNVTAIESESPDPEVNQVIRALQAQKGARKIYKSLCEFNFSFTVSTLTLCRRIQGGRVQNLPSRLCKLRGTAPGTADGPSQRQRHIYSCLEVQEGKPDRWGLQICLLRRIQYPHLLAQPINQNLHQRSLSHRSSDWKSHSVRRSKAGRDLNNRDELLSLGECHDEAGI